MCLTTASVIQLTRWIFLEELQQLYCWLLLIPLLVPSFDWMSTQTAFKTLTGWFRTPIQTSFRTLLKAIPKWRLSLQVSMQPHLDTNVGHSTFLHSSNDQYTMRTYSCSFRTWLQFTHVSQVGNTNVKGKFYPAIGYYGWGLLPSASSTLICIFLKL